MLTGSNTAQLLEVAIDKHPGLPDLLSSCALAHNEEYLEVGSTIELRDGDEVAIIPPISGG